MNPESLNEDLLNDLGEDFAQRLRQGEYPSIAEYSGRYQGEQAQEVREFLESIALLEEMKRGSEIGPKRSTAMPEVFGRYRIEHSLGEGGMGAVYLAHDSQLNRKVALKTPKFNKASEANLVERFYREARSAATLQHPNICPVYDVGEIDGIHYISMAYVDGRPLSDYISAKKPTPVHAVVNVVRKIALALHEAHQHGVVHRDLKPANVMINRHNEPVVMDFGLARQFDDDEQEEQPPNPDHADAPLTISKVEARLTQDGVLIGSPGYMSPEQITGNYAAMGPASDVYSLGVLLFELLTGALPFEGDGQFISIAKSVVAEPAPDATALRADLDPEIAKICQKAMAKKPEDRFESMKSFADSLTSLLRSSNSSHAADSLTIDDSVSGRVRAESQCQLARSFCDEGQYAAAISILERVVDEHDATVNEFAEWAEGELPRVKVLAADAATQAAANPTVTEPLRSTADAPALGGVQTAAPTSSASSVGAVPRWFYGVISVPIIVICLLIAAILFNGLRAQRNSNRKPAPPSGDLASRDGNPAQANNATSHSKSDSTSNSTDGQQAAVDKPDTAGGASLQIPIAERIYRLDFNRDGMVSRGELSRRPLRLPLRRILENFNAFDLAPRDGKLDEFEIARIERIWTSFNARNRDRRP